MKHKKPFYGSMGSISEATLRPQDLIRRFISELETLRLTRSELAKVREVIRASREEITFEVQGNYGQGFEAVCTEETRGEARQRLFEYDSNEPQYAHRVRRVREEITDSSAYWDEMAHEDLETLFDILNNHALPYFYFGAHPGDGADFGYWLSEEFESDFDGLKVSDLAEVPKAHSGEVLQVSDHGNMTLYAYTRGRAREVWALV